MKNKWIERYTNIKVWSRRLLFWKGWTNQITQYCKKKLENDETIFCTFFFGFCGWSSFHSSCATLFILSIQCVSSRECICGCIYLLFCCCDSFPLLLTKIDFYFSFLFSNEEFNVGLYKSIVVCSILDTNIRRFAVS